jgi:hypothetical protein
VDRNGVEQLIRSVLIEYGLPLTLVGLALQGQVWMVDLREGQANPVRLTIHDGSGQLIRRALMRALDLEDTNN